MQTTPLAIKATGLKKQFDGTPVLKGVDFELAAGEVHAIVGQNGAGKSTLMKIINGLYQPDEGRIELFGQPVHFATPRDAREGGIAMVYQDLSLVDSMSVAENIFMANWAESHFGLLDQRGMNLQAQELLEQMGIADEIEPTQPVATLSMGQQQFLEIAKAIAQKARILILDEPTASLSNQEIARLFTLIEHLKAQGVAIIYITHYLRDIFKICDSITVLRDGRCVRRVRTADTRIEALLADMLGHHADSSVEWVRPTPAPGMEPLLELRALSTRQLDAVSLRVYPGQVVGLAGLLGSGRTEILNAIFGLDPILSGEVLVNGQPVQIRSPRDAIEQGINLVPEDRREQGLVLDFSVMDNLLMSSLRDLAAPVLLDEQRGQRIAADLIQRLQIKTSGPQQTVRFLSGGNQQKVVIGKCMSASARVLLLDDPTFGIDLAAKLEVMRIVNNYAAAGNAVIFVSSEYGEIASFCDATYIVNRGRITGQMQRHEQSEEQLLAAVQ
ncbi:ribose transport system ATP-binding protein [Andreprevotia lacus DSM 23236]|jgi:ribose transport system ATP-binding protein|uniref:Ribose transport system ATP-binding protein n=1 Tax=Andreprevotia lacus DSM 23236 TaxID=1121001 RepID=A0A1W1WXA3_9NEIS|nr:sugar ABC transporter ATP-binding protein [Andreprevotia lacus]SMC16275.1 ribose transport system ATP-binding protein [Andreprevotia lacus DSM 23236]